MDLSTLKSFKSHAFNLSRALSHSFFLQSCLHLGLTPNNLTLPIPFSATPPTLRHTLATFQYIQSVRLTHTVLEHNTRAAQTHATQLKQLFSTICHHHPHLLPSVHSTLLSAQRALDRLAELKLRKLSNLCTNYLNGGGVLPFRHPLATPPPLISNQPSLASYLNLPTPPHTPPKLPPKFKPFHNSDAAPGAQHHAAPGATPGTAPDKIPVVNLSSHPLTPSEASVLSKGLSFSPTPSFNHFRLVADAASFARHLRWKYHWSTQTTTTTSNQTTHHPSLSRFKPHSSHEPPKLPSTHPIELYISHILANISDSKFPTTLPQRPNLSKSEKSALRSLRTNPNILILPADKGNTTVVLDKDDYLAEADRQLSDRSTYKPLASNPTQSYNQDLHNLISTAALPNVRSQSLCKYYPYDQTISGVN